MKIRNILFCLLSSFILQPAAFPQGPLTPPGSPGPTMKTLDQVEARTIVNAANTPGDANNQFIISAPGSYYLSGNITGVSGKNGIAINADNVTLDLNGFALLGVSGSLSGVNTTGQLHRNLRVHNGSAQNWPITGVNVINAGNSQFDHLRVSQNNSGFRCGNGNVLSAITATNNTNDGIYTSEACTITASISVTNLIGFNIQSHCTIIGCTAVANTSFGVFLGDNCTIKDCTASLNNTGIVTSNNCQIISNDASGSTGTGIIAGITRGVGIQTTGSNNRIDSNHCIGNASYGIKSSGPTADFIIRNTCFGNTGAASGTATANYSPKNGQFFGALSNLNDAGVSPWANF